MANETPNEPSASPQACPSKSDEQRLIELEELFTHLQHTLESLSDVVIDVQGRLDTQAGALKHLRQRIDRLGDDGAVDE